MVSLCSSCNHRLLEHHQRQCSNGRGLKKFEKEKALWKGARLKTHLFVTDPHAHPTPQQRAEYLESLSMTSNQTVVIVGGDVWDMPSLSSYDKGRKSFKAELIVLILMLVSIGLIVFSPL